MKDFKEKLPDFKEVTSIASKLFKDVKNSICEIINDYKKKRSTTEVKSAPKAKKAEPKVAEKKPSKSTTSKK